MLYPIIDIGSNTVKISVLDEERIFTSPIFFKAVPLSLKSKIRNEQLPADAIEELVALLREYIAIARRLTDRPPFSFATASLRGLKNKEEVLLRVREECGLEVRVISGEEEAYFSFLGAKGRRPVRSGCTVDLGGGSTEVSLFRKDTLLRSVSMPFGALSLFERFFADQNAPQIDLCRRYVADIIGKMAPADAGKALLLSGGSAKAVLRYKNLICGKNNSSVSLKDFDDVLEHFQNGDEKERKFLYQQLRDRFRLIPPAVITFSELARHCRCEQIYVSKTGVREGCLFARLSGKTGE